jgi:hypothetical protein
LATQLAAVAAFRSAAAGASDCSLMGVTSSGRDSRSSASRGATLPSPSPSFALLRAAISRSASQNSWKPMLWLLESSPKTPPPLRITTCMNRRSASCEVKYLVRGGVRVRVRVRVRGGVRARVRVRVRVGVRIKGGVRGRPRAR